MNEDKELSSLRTGHHGRRQGVVVAGEESEDEANSGLPEYRLYDVHHAVSSNSDYVIRVA